jgi:hypothetical protein
MVQKYPFTFTISHKILLAVAISCAIMPIFFGKFHPLFLIFPSISIFIVVVMLLTVGKTAIELSEKGLRFHFIIRLGNLLFSKEVPRFVKWDEIQGMIVCYTHFHETKLAKHYARYAPILKGKEKIAKIFLKNSKGSPKYFFIPFKNLKDSDVKKLIDNLRKKIPDITNDNEIFSRILQNVSLPPKIQYKNLTLTHEGITLSEEVIPWNRIIVIDYEDFHSRMFNISYQSKTGSFGDIMIKSKRTEEFRNFIRYLIKNANNASIDASLLKIFSKS